MRHFAGIRSADLEFAQGLNVLHGPNELGKTTLVTAIRAVLLLQDSATASQTFRDWHVDHPPQVTLTFETEPQQIWRVRKSFGKGSEGSSYLEFSRDGIDFTQDAKGRDVDGRIRDTLRWGLDAPGGKGKKKGFSGSFLTTTLLADQGDVTAVLTRGLGDDPDDSGKQRLTEALQALTEDPVFRQVLAATQQKVGEAYAPSGQKRRSRGSPWMDLRTQRQAAEQHRTEIRTQANESEGARDHVHQLRDALNETQAHLDEAKRLHARLETAWQQQQDRSAVDAGIVEAEKERDRILGLADRLSDVAADLAAAEEALSAANVDLQESARVLKTKTADHESARLRLAVVERSDTEQARKIRKQEIDKRSLEIESRRRAAEQRMSEGAAVRDLEAKTEVLRAEVKEKSDTLAEARTLAEAAQRHNQVAADEIAGIDERRLAIRILAARRNRDGARQSQRQADELSATAAAKRKEARTIRAGVAKLALPGEPEINALAALHTELRIVEGKLTAGISLKIRPSRRLTAHVQRDESPVDDKLITKTTSLDASSRLRLALDDVGEIDIRGGSAKAQKDATDLRQRWRKRTAGIFKRLTVTDLEGVRQQQRDCADGVKRAETLEHDATTLAAQAEAAADTGATVDLLDGTVDRLEQQMVSSLASEGDLEGVLQRYESANESDDAGLERQRGSLQLALDDRTQQVQALEQQVAKDEGILETKKQELASRDRDLRRASVALAHPWHTVLTGATAEVEQLQAERRTTQQELETLDGDSTSKRDEAQSAVEQTTAAVDEAAQRHGEIKTRAEGAQGIRDRLTGELETRRELAEREDFGAATTAVQQLQTSLKALPVPDTDVTDAQRSEMDALVLMATTKSDGLRAELQKAEGALEQVGGHYIQERLERADDAVKAIDQREQELDLDYGAWQLLRDTLQEAEAEDAVHLGKALVEPITQRMAELTAGRYGNLAIGPDLATEGIELAGMQRELDSLSVGTREQLATVLRLVIAEKIGSTLVLDDQLVQSDASRMHWLRTFMTECAEKFQILVLTCRAQEYESVGIENDPRFRSIALAGQIQRSLPESTKG